MTIVTTKTELKNAIERKAFPISCRGEIAKQLKKRKKRSKRTKIAGAALLIGGIAAIPFTGGASSAGVAAGATAMGLTATVAGTAAISATELAIILGGTAAIIGILKNRKVKLGPDGDVTIE
ncbi:MAG: hypothetical protein K2H58_01680 [Paramuribaculum sp.]|nr:hypothetical protein [Paramuribaculum sp.]MDE6050576.1 hypothetical protein [Paramuribaculum sp.]